MKLVSLTICRNAAWSIEAVIRHALQFCDSCVVFLHATTDNTADILTGINDRVTVVSTEGTRWDEMVHRQASLDFGREIGGTHFLILDDDEMLTQNLVPLVRDAAANLAPGQVMRIPMRCCWRSLDQYRVDSGSPFSNAQASAIFADAKNVYWCAHAAYQYHHRHPHGSRQVDWANVPEGGILHFQHANWKRLVLKQNWYMAMELCQHGSIKANYWGTMNEKNLKLKSIPVGWWGEHKKLIRLDQRPWQLDDLHRMVKEKGKQFFTSRGVKADEVLAEWGITDV